MQKNNVLEPDFFRRKISPFVFNYIQMALNLPVSLSLLLVNIILKAVLKTEDQTAKIEKIVE